MIENLHVNDSDVKEVTLFVCFGRKVHAGKKKQQEELKPNQTQSWKQHRRRSFMDEEAEQRHSMNTRICSD